MIVDEGKIIPKNLWGLFGETPFDNTVFVKGQFQTDIKN